MAHHEEMKMGHLERVVSASKLLISVSTLDGVIDIDRFTEAEYREIYFDFYLDEQQTLWDLVRTMFGDYVVPSVTLDDILQLSTIDREAVIESLVTAYGATRESVSL